MSSASPLLPNVLCTMYPQGSTLKRLHIQSSRRIRHRRHIWLALMTSMLQTAGAIHHMKRAPIAWVSPRDSSIPLVVSNLCTETIYPAVLTQAGNGPSTSGFELNPGNTMNLTVGSDWQGRVWGRTNCSFNNEGTGPANTGGLNGGGQACGTGDCNGIVKCMVTVSSYAHGAEQAVYDNNMLNRAIHLSPLRSSPSPPLAAKPFTTSLLSMATTSPSPSSPSIPSPATPILHKSPLIS